MSGDVENENKRRYKTKNLVRFRLSLFNSGKQKEKLFKHCGIYVRAGGSLQFISTF
jgi:hypothetical protein